VTKAILFLVIMSLSNYSWSEANIQNNDEQDVPEVVSLDQGTMERISEHLKLSTADQDKFEFVGATSGLKCVKGPKVKQSVKDSIDWTKKLNPIWWMGNADEPVPPEWYRPDSKFRKVLWYYRNPFHNFSFYVIGIAEKTDKSEYSRCGKFPSDVFAPGYGWNYSYIKYKGLRLPFVSYWSPTKKLYFGWRERGNIGIKINISTTAKNK